MLRCFLNVLRIFLLALFLLLFSSRTQVFLFTSFSLRSLAEVVMSIEIDLKTVLLWNPILHDETATKRLNTLAKALMMKPSTQSHHVLFIACNDTQCQQFRFVDHLIIPTVTSPTHSHRNAPKDWKKGLRLFI